MPNPESSMLSQMLVATPDITKRAELTRRHIQEGELHTMSGLSRRAGDLASRFRDPNSVDQTSWVSLGDMKLAIKGVGNEFDIHAQIVVKDKEDEKVALDLHRDQAVDEFGKPVDYFTARTVVDHIQASLQERKTA